MDIVIVLFGGLLILPILILIAIILKIDSPGKLFYGQFRIGKDGKKFQAWKFRTMVADADLKLQEYLLQNPDLQLEWDANHKLKNDPRVTRLGKVMRRYSIDELPQLINVLKGEISLVGPHPIVSDEIHYYSDMFDPYIWVVPGIIGLWQVSGRSNVVYEERVRLDEYYIRNWSVWLDIHILVRTISAVLRREGLTDFFESQQKC